MQLSSVDFLQAECVGNVAEMQERPGTSLLLLLVIFSPPSLEALESEIGSGLPSWFVLSPVERGGLQRWAAYAHSHSFRTSFNPSHIAVVPCCLSLGSTIICVRNHLG